MLNTDLKNTLTAVELFGSASRTANANGAGVDVKDYIGGVVVLDCGSATAGSSPTADFKIQDSADNSSFADVSGYTFTQVTTTKSLQTLQIDKRNVRRYIRAVFTIGGTSSPAFPASATFLGQKQVV